MEGPVHGLSGEAGYRIMMGLSCRLVMLSSDELTHKVVLCVKGMDLINVNMPKFRQFCFSIEEIKRLEGVQTSVDSFVDLFLRAKHGDSD